MSSREIEKRLVAIEQEIAHLKADRRPNHKAHPIESLERIHGRFENDESFREAMSLGRNWRKSQRGGNRKSKVKSK